MKYRTTHAIIVFFLGITIIVLLLTWMNPITRSDFDFEGAGTQISPYQINSLEDFEKFRDLVNSGESFSNIYFKQMRDLDLLSIENWTPIGVYGKNHYFWGHYDGDGHTINNLTCIHNDNVGLFGVLCGEVRNLGIESGYIEGLHIGGITSHGLESATIINCYNKATVHGIYRAGGIADNLGGGKIEYCWNLGEVSADSEVNYGVSSYSAIIDHCYCVDLPVAPGSNCTVSNTMTIKREELKEHINKVRLLYGNISEEFKAIRTDGLTISFVKENKYSNIVGWLQTYFLLISLILCSMVTYIIARISIKRNQFLKEEEKEIVCLRDSCFENNFSKKTFFSVFLFLVMFFCGAKVVNQTLVLKRDDGIVTMQSFYKQPEGTVDVLILGSSRAGVNLDLETMWKYYGISGYTCWGSVQPFWNSYYFLKEAVNVSRPKVIILDVGAATYPFEYSDDGRQYTNTYGIKSIFNRIQAVQVSSPQKRWSNLILGLPIYHSRFNELSQGDFSHYTWNIDVAANFKGNSVIYGSGNYSLEDVSEIKEIGNLNSKEEEYLNKIIEYCQNEELPLLLIATPNPGRTREQPYFNAVQKIADEQSIPFINFNLLDAETSFEAEDFWTDGHLNTSGGRKISSYLGSYLMSNYMLLDHRGDENYKSWDVFANNMESNYLKLITEADDYFSEIARNGWTAIIVKQNIPEESEAYHSFLLETVDTGLNLSFLTEEKKCCYMVNASTSQKCDHTQESHLKIDDKNMAIDFMYSGTVFLGGEEIYKLPKEGIVCMVYDSFSKEIVDIAVFSEEMQYKVVHQ